MGIVSGDREFVSDIPMIHQGKREWKPFVNRLGVVVGVCSVRFFG